MAGGLSTVLLGSESGEFKSLWPHSSGIAINADAKGAAISDFNQDLRPDLVVGINDEEPKFFYNQTTSRWSFDLRVPGKTHRQLAPGSTSCWKTALHKPLKFTAVEAIFRSQHVICSLELANRVRSKKSRFAGRTGPRKFTIRRSI
jgi:hypothetical protein